MRNTILLLLSLALAVVAFGQTSSARGTGTKTPVKGTVLVQSDVEAALFIDGEANGNLQADIPRKVQVFFGQHLLSIRTVIDQQPYQASQAVTVNSPKQVVVLLSLKAQIAQQQEKARQAEEESRRAAEEQRRAEEERRRPITVSGQGEGDSTGVKESVARMASVNEARQFAERQLDTSCRQRRRSAKIVVTNKRVTNTSCNQTIDNLWNPWNCTVTMEGDCYQQ